MTRLESVDTDELLLYRPPPERGIFANRTLNLRAIAAVGYDMDYTLIHYHVRRWEGRAYRHVQRKLVELGWGAVAELRFEADAVIRGLVLDLDLGNIVKPNRFGYIQRAAHGTQPLAHEEQRQAYTQTLIHLAEQRFVFVNTLFSLCEVCMFSQLVDLLDAGRLPAELRYRDLYRQVKRSLDETHVEGALKEEIIASPERYIDRDAQTPLALLDQKRAGKKLLLITNSEWSYTREIMRYAFDGALPGTMCWRDLFDVVVVAARKPAFFSQRGALFQVVDPDDPAGLMMPVVSGLREGGVFVGGDATQVEALLGVSGDRILYVGDHIYGDVHVSKRLFRWRTALILRELEVEMLAEAAFVEKQASLAALMQRKQRLEAAAAQARLRQLRRRAGDEPIQQDVSDDALRAGRLALRETLEALDEEIAPLAEAAGALVNPRWGLLMRAGNDKSHLARQVERYADIYMSRVSNFTFITPYAYLRAPRGSLPHDR